MKYQKYITINPKIIAGKPVITGTRIPVDLILKKLAQNIDVNDILKDYPRLTKEAIQATLWYAGMVIDEEEIYPYNA